jgi:D-alanyl-D-alanine carboxypeptidase
MRIALVVAVIGALAAPAAVMARETAEAQIAQALERTRADLHAPGMALAVWRKGRLVATVASGVRAEGDPAPVEPGDAFHIGSITKSFTSALAARLVEQGRMRWDETVGERLGILIPGMLPAYRAVTLEQLLSHEGGIVGQLGRDQLGAVMQAPDMTHRRLTAAAAALSLPPLSPPGAAMHYSNPGYVIAAAMIEQATGESWEALVKADVIAPLHLASAGFGPPTGAAPRGHARAPDGTLKPLDPASPGADNPPFLIPAGGLHLSMADLARFAADQLRGVKKEPGTLLKPESYARLHRERLRHQGLGWGQGPDGGFDNSGSNGRWYAYLRAMPADDLVVAVAMNAPTDDAGEERLGALAEAVQAVLRREGAGR